MSTVLISVDEAQLLMGDMTMTVRDVELRVGRVFELERFDVLVSAMDDFSHGLSDMRRAIELLPTLKPPRSPRWPVGAPARMPNYLETGQVLSRHVARRARSKLPAKQRYYQGDF